MSPLDPFQLSTGMNYPAPSSTLGTGMYYMNPADTPDPSLPKMPLGSGMYGMGSGTQAPATQPNLLGLLSAGGAMSKSGQQQPQMHQMGPTYRAGLVNFMPSSAITMPYSTGSQGPQSLLQQILQHSQSNPLQR